MKKLVTIVVLLFVNIILFAQGGTESNLETQFKNPPNSTKPKTWMHAMSGNMSKLGMTKDLEAIAAAGQGGVLLFNIANGIPYGEVAYNSDKHHEVLTHAAKECERLNLSFGVHNCDGWTSSGGPWVTPENSMKSVVWSETIVKGGEKVSVSLPQPSTLEGFYKDIAVVAYPAFDSELVDAKLNPKVTASDKTFDTNILTDKFNFTSSILKKGNDENSYLTLDYGLSQEISSIYLSYLGTGVKANLEISSDGKNFNIVRTFKRFTRLGKLQWIINEQFDGIKSRYFRLSFDKDIEIIDLKLTTTKPFKDYLKYSGLKKPNTYLNISKGVDVNHVINKAFVINLSSSFTSGGKLNAKLPEGKWMVMRFGYTSTGARNWPASKWGIGLECDKFSRSAMKAHFDAFVQKVIDNSKPVAPNALQYIEIDSYEMEGQNWTDGLETIFKKEKGYDIIPFLPVFAGRYIESTDAVAGVSYDFNDVCTKLMTNNYFKYFTELCNENGLKSYIEPYGGGPVSTLDISAHIDLPMTEFWMNRTNQKRLTGTIDGAHIYGKNIISSEAFTSTPELNWNNHPALAKTWGDMAWVKGVNEFMFHRFVHQANTHVKPGLTMGKWGSHFDRTQTWWMNAGVEWFKYISRGSYLLRQGYPVADVLVFVGDLPHKDGIKRSKLKYKLPESFNYDCINPDALINRISIKNKKLMLPEGNAYSHLLLQDVSITTLPTLRKIKSIIDAGIPVVGDKPIRLAGYKISNADKEEFENLCNYIWSKPNCNYKFDASNLSPDFKVAGLNVPFVHRRTGDTDIYFFYNDGKDFKSYECVFRVTNKIPELWNPNTGEVTRLANFSSDKENTRVWIDLEALESTFIVFREPANHLKSITGITKNKTLYLKSDNTVVLETDKSEATFVTWNDGEITKIPHRKLPPPIDLSSHWKVEFLKKHNYEATKDFDKLIDWKHSDDNNIKYYSGTANYLKSFKIEKKEEDLRYILDLGDVDIVAEVIINGNNAGVLWMAPFQLDISDFLENGINELEIKITNQWSNRLIGDENYPIQDGGYKKSGYIPNKNSKMPNWYLNNEQMPDGPRVTFSSWDFYKKGDKLVSSGLKGPVKIKYKRVLEIKRY